MATLETASLIVSIGALLISIYFWKKQFRPILSAMVKTHAGNDKYIAYDLEIINCGSLPARNIQLSVNQSDLDKALEKDATENDKQRWLACFETKIPILHNNGSCKCSFGTTGEYKFWKYQSSLPITLKYEGFWRKKKYSEKVTVHIIDSDSFTGYMWGEKHFQTSSWTLCGKPHNLSCQSSMSRTGHT